MVYCINHFVISARILMIPKLFSCGNPLLINGAYPFTTPLRSLD